MPGLQKEVQRLLERIDRSIRDGDDERLTLTSLSKEIGYSECYTSRVFKKVSGMRFADYLRFRRLAFALKEVRDTGDGLLDIALRYGFSSHEAFTRAFTDAYGVSPKEYRKHPYPVVLRTVLCPFDCYICEQQKGKGTVMKETGSDVKVYYVKIPAHKFLHIRSYESIGYWDFWQKQSLIPGQDCETICGLLDSIKGKLDDAGGSALNASSGQLMAWINAPTGRLCSWGIPLAEAYGVRLRADYAGEVPKPLMLMDVPEGEYIVFEHGPFDFRNESAGVEAKIEAAMKAHDYAADGYELDITPERVFYFYHDCERFFKYVRPIRRIAKDKE